MRLAGCACRRCPALPGAPARIKTPDKPECLRNCLAQDKYLFIIASSLEPLQGGVRRHPPIHCRQKAPASMLLPLLRHLSLLAALAQAKALAQCGPLHRSLMPAGLACKQGAPPGPVAG